MSAVGKLGDEPRRRVHVGRPGEGPRGGRGEAWGPSSRSRCCRGAARSACWSASTRLRRRRSLRSARPARRRCARCSSRRPSRSTTRLAIQRAEALSVTDDLTRLSNSRYLNLVLRREDKRAMRSGRPLSLLFIDLDGFKRSTPARPPGRQQGARRGGAPSSAGAPAKPTSWPGSAATSSR